MHKLLRLWIANWSRALTYRGDIFLWSLTEAITPLLSLAIWYTVAQNASGPLTPSQTITYYILAIFTLSMTNVWNGYFLIPEILDGKIVPFLIRPVGFFWFYLYRNLTAKVIRLIPQLITFGIIFAVFSQWLSPTIFEIRNIIFFVISLIGGLSIAFTLDMAFAMLGFWIEDALQIREFKDAIAFIASGLLIPFAFMPPAVQATLSWLPFRSIISTPIEIMLGQAPGIQVWQLLGIQLVWVVIFSIALRILWKRGLKVYAVPGQ